MGKDTLDEDLVHLWDRLTGHSFLDTKEPELVQEYPLLPLRDQVLLPNAITLLSIGRDVSIKAVEMAFSNGQPMVAVAQCKPDLKTFTLQDLCSIGTKFEIVRMLHMPDGTTSILAKGHRRVRIEKLVKSDAYLMVRAKPLSESQVSGPGVEALMRAVLALFEQCVELNPTVSEEAFVFAMNIDEPGWLADMVASSYEFRVQERQELLEELNPEARLKQLSILLARELDVLELKEQIHVQTQQQVDRSQREFFLREQLRVIQNELGEGDIYSREIAKLTENINASNMPDLVKEKALHEIERLSGMMPMSPESGIIQTYLDWLLALPWQNESTDNLDIPQAEETLESSHYGLKKAKERILEHMAVRKLAADKMRSPILCFVGPPGTGKTSLGKSIAQALGRHFLRVSLGGIHDEAEIKGHRRTYIGALPGRIIQTMRQSKTINPLFMLDEIDKLGIDFRGDPSAALLELLDPEQNDAYSDHYLDLPYNLSKVMFITTANILDPIPPALRDRMEVIEFDGYTSEEKLKIAHRFLIPKQKEAHGLDKTEIAFSDQAILAIIHEYTYEAGVRNLEREIAKICRKLARRLAEDKPLPGRITANSLNKYLGPAQFENWKGLSNDEIGVSTGVAWTEAGGDLMPIEVALLEGKGNLTLTGQLGEVMQESAQTALSCARTLLDKLDTEPPDLDKLDIHIHAPEGAIPKDGPSAGVTIATALISALTERPIHRDVAMTGEITLRGRVLTVGGLKEKVMAAYRAGIKTFILPKGNRKDIVDIPLQVRKTIEFVFVESIDQVLERALLPDNN
ncbi:MAG: endopeptidase La [Anaerolineae bacterium]|nr:endopeptidase La [Anaerolineae bacterium]